MNFVEGFINQFYENQTEKAIDSCSGNTNPNKISPDQESWIRSRVLTAIRMGVAVWKNKRVSTDDPILNKAWYGIAEGTAEEIVDELHLSNCYVNFKDLRASKELY